MRKPLSGPDCNFFEFGLRVPCMNKAARHGKLRAGEKGGISVLEACVVSARVLPGDRWR